MKAPQFWWSRNSFIAFLIAPLGVIYGGIAAYRMRKSARVSALPVICVGNLVAGGAGKTPTAIWIANELHTLGYRPVFLTRGYGGALKGPVLVNADQHTIAEIGDEPFLLTRHAPTILARDRVAGAAKAQEFGDVIIMDDGLQNPYLQKDLTIAVIDSGQGIGNGRVIPAGPLRAPLAAQLPKIAFCLVVGDEGQADDLGRLFSKPVYRAFLQPDATQITRLQGRDIFAFAGIGRPEKFFTTLKRAGVRVTISEIFSDHHIYSRSTLERLIDIATKQDVLLVTTAKDHVRIRDVAPDLSSAFLVLDVELISDEAAPMIEQIIAAIDRRRYQR